MTDEEPKTNKNSWIPLVLIGIVVIAGAIIMIKKNQGADKLVDESGNIIVSDNDPFAQWHGKPAPDFTVTDIDGNKHTLSDYKGKDLMVVFWATWCPPCLAEIPHLKELREQKSSDELAMLAISSSEEEDTVKQFAESNGLNYTVAVLGDSYPPSPFIDVEFIPTTFFIDPEGRIKNVVVQSLTLEQIKAILEAPTVQAN